MIRIRGSKTAKSAQTHRARHALVACASVHVRAHPEAHAFIGRLSHVELPTPADQKFAPAIVAAAAKNDRLRIAVRRIGKLPHVTGHIVEPEGTPRAWVSADANGTISTTARTFLLIEPGVL